MHFKVTVSAFIMLDWLSVSVMMVKAIDAVVVVSGVPRARLFFFLGPSAVCWEARAVYSAVSLLCSRGWIGNPGI